MSKEPPSWSIASGIGTCNVARDVLIPGICNLSELSGPTTWISRFHGPVPCAYVSNQVSSSCRSGLPLNQPLHQPYYLNNCWSSSCSSHQHQRPQIPQPQGDVQPDRYSDHLIRSFCNSRHSFEWSCKYSGRYVRVGGSVLRGNSGMFWRDHVGLLDRVGFDNRPGKVESHARLARLRHLCHQSCGQIIMNRE